MTTPYDAARTVTTERWFYIRGGSTAGDPSCQDERVAPWAVQRERLAIGPTSYTSQGIAIGTTVLSVWDGTNDQS